MRFPACSHGPLTVQPLGKAVCLLGIQEETRDSTQTGATALLWSYLRHNMLPILLCLVKRALINSDHSQGERIPQDVNIQRQGSLGTISGAAYQRSPTNLFGQMSPETAGKISRQNFQMNLENAISIFRKVRRSVHKFINAPYNILNLSPESLELLLYCISLNLFTAHQ